MGERSAASCAGALSEVYEAFAQPRTAGAKVTDGLIEFGRVGRRVIEADFSGDDRSSDGGLLPLKRADERIGLRRVAAAVA